MSCVALYSFRLSVDKGTPDEIQKWCNEWFSYWIFQTERGDEGYEHYQGEGSLRKKRRPTEIVGAMTRQGAIVPNYIRPIPTEEAQGIKNLGHLKERYASKVDTRIAGPFQSTSNDNFIPRQYQGIDLTMSAWQKTMINIGEEECRTLNGRTIHWIYDPVGSHGKTSLSAVLKFYKNGLRLPAINDSKELLQATCNILADSNNRDPGIIILDLPRALPKSNMHGFTSALEEMKAGMVCDVRNHFRQWNFNTPSVWVFSNSTPPMTHLSADRWKIWTFAGAGYHSDLIPYVPEQADTEDL